MTDKNQPAANIVQEPMTKDKAEFMTKLSCMLADEVNAGALDWNDVLSCAVRVITDHFREQFGDAHVSSLAQLVFTAAEHPLNELRVPVGESVN